ncbi:MAG: alpha-amlyase [Flavobacterium sp.]|nr:MAG: alpha-amlyase [Flavobacterium sp.]
MENKPQRFLKPLGFALLLFTIFTQSTLAQIQRTEPPFWFAGMKNPELQILFYGKNIAQNDVSVSNNIVIKNIVKTENPNYLFVTIDTKNVPASDIIFSFKNKGKTAFTKTYSLKERRANSELRQGFDSSDVIYLLMPDRFANGNPNNDSTPNTTEKADRSKPSGRHGGDIEGIIKNLDYIEQTGSTALWSTPLCEDNDARGSYHGYGQSDVYKIDPRYGTNEDYLKLSSELHKRGMKLILDYVTNHWGKHWTLDDLPTYDWLHQFPGYAQTNYRMTTQFDTNASAIDTKMCMDGWFVKSMPDLNQSNPLMLNYLIQNAIWWIEYADLDGFRVDTYSYCDKAGIAKWTKAITDEYPHFNIVGEVWMHNQAAMAYWQKDSKVGAIENYNSNLPSVMDFTLHDALGSVFNEDKPEWDKGIIKIYENFTNDFLYPNPNNILVMLENHDTQRFNQIYSGSEIGMRGDKTVGDHDIRRDFPGGWNGDPNNAFTASGRTAEQKQYFDYTSKILNWRKNKSVVHSGKTTHYVPENNVYVYFRYNEKETVMVVINNSDKAQTFKTGRFAENIKSFKQGKDVISGKTIDLSNEITADPKSAMILELE